MYVTKPRSRRSKLERGVFDRCIDSDIAKDLFFNRPITTLFAHLFQKEILLPDPEINWKTEWMKTSHDVTLCALKEIFSRQ